MSNPTIFEQAVEAQKTMGVYINAILLLLSLLEVLLCFSSFGIVIRALYKRRGHSDSSSYGSLLSYCTSPQSRSSRIAIQEILGAGSGPEYQARKDRLIRWLSLITNNPNSNSIVPSTRPTSAHGSQIIAIRPGPYVPRRVQRPVPVIAYPYPK